MGSKPINIHWIRTGSQLHEKKSCIGSNYRQFAINIKILIIKLIPLLLARVFGLTGANKTGLNPLIFLISAEICL